MTVGRRCRGRQRRRHEAAKQLPEKGAELESKDRGVPDPAVVGGREEARGSSLTAA